MQEPPQIEVDEDSGTPLGRVDQLEQQVEETAEVPDQLDEDEAADDGPSDA